MKRSCAPAVLLASFAASGVARARQYSDFRIRPNPARAGEAVDLLVRAAWCDYLPAPHAVVQAGDDAVVVAAPDSDACFGVGGTVSADLAIPLGAFAPGAYRMRCVGAVTQSTLADIPFAVDVGPTAVPAGGRLRRRTG